MTKDKEGYRLGSCSDDLVVVLPRCRYGSSPATGPWADSPQPAILNNLSSAINQELTSLLLIFQQFTYIRNCKQFQNQQLNIQLIGENKFIRQTRFQRRDPEMEAGPINSTERDSVIVGNGAQHKQG